MRRIPGALLLVWLIASAATPAAAHKMKAFAAAEGAEIAGYAYFSPGADRAVAVTVTVTDGSGATIHSGTTDEEGAFRFPARTRSDHRISVSGADGHAASFTVRAAELPESLPPAGTASAVAAAPVAEPAAAAPAPSPATADLQAIVDRSVARQLRPLREQIDAWYEKIWWHDVLGGIGYIVGVAGLVFGLSRRTPKSPAP